jgi:type IV pilus assembly protein PilB
MGVEPFLVGSALDCIVAQSLARRLCDKCKERYHPSRPELEAMGWDIGLQESDETPFLFRAAGCSKCSRTGYFGRFAIHEVLPVTEEIERIIVDRGHTEDLRKVAIAEGMLTLRQSGLRAVRAGTTSMEEILRVIA